MRALLLVALLAAGIDAGAAQDGFDEAAFAPTDLAHAEEASCMPGPKRTTMVDVTLSRLRMDARTSRMMRPLAADAVGVLAQYGKLTGKAPPAFVQEVRVRIDGQERWLPIHPELEAAWRDALADDRPVTLYVVRVGCEKPDGNDLGRVIFAIIDFQAATPEPSESPQ